MDRLIPIFRIYLNGKLLEGADRRKVAYVSTENHAKKADAATITLRDSSMKIFEDPRFAENVKVTIEGGWKDDYREWFQGVIVKTVPLFPDTGIPELRVECADKTVTGAVNKKPETWRKMRHSDVVLALARRQTPPWKTKVTPTTKVWEQVTKSGMSDMAFIMQLAEEDGYLAYMDGDTLFYAPPEYQQSSAAVYDYRKGKRNLFNLDIDKSEQTAPSTVSKSGIDATTGKEFTVVSTETKPSPVGANDKKYQGATGEWKETSGNVLSKGAPTPTRDRGDAVQQVARISSSASFATKAVARVKPSTRLLAKKNVDLRYVSIYTGTYFVESVTNTWDAAGWSQSCELTKNAPGQSEVNKKSETAATENPASKSQVGRGEKYAPESGKWSTAKEVN